MKKQLFLLLMIIFTTACSGQTQEIPPTPIPVETEATTAIPDTVVVEPTKEPASLPPESQAVSFASEDGQELLGIFYPAAMESAPVIVLMHWYPGDQNEWTEIAFWLQNRGLQGEKNGVPWKDPTWFPDRDGDQSFNVLTFTFRNCEGRCNAPEPAAWLLDAQASLEFARTLEGVDPDRVIAIGASIGADGAIGGCAVVLESDPRACLGALSLSPGSYLGLDYQDLVTQLGESDLPRPAWCLYDENDADSLVCTLASGAHYYQESWSDGYLHGFHLFNPSLEPNTLERLLEFLDLVLGT